MIGERLGKPSIGIMTTMFVSAANLMANILGAENYRYVTIEHPISSADPQKLMAWAKKAADESAQLLSGQHN
ncbi:MAG: hypothetical protein ACI8W7_000106 [Gammaproteobacteria bacterium]